MKLTITLFALLVVSAGYFINESFAEISENQVFLLEGSGFAVTEEVIKISEIDLGLLSQEQHGSTINFLIEDGFITLDDEEFLIYNLEGKFLREGRFIRINGDIESLRGFDTSISFFGRLVEESRDASVYGFTGRITTPDDTYKIIYTTKLSTLTKTDTTQTSSNESSDLTIHILTGSSTQGIISSWIQSSDSATLGYFSQDRITARAGISITFVNDDTVSHKILSGTGLGQSTRVNQPFILCDDPQELPDGFSFDYNKCSFTLNGKIQSDDIQPGDNWTATFDEVGTYKLMDTDYPWMNMVVQIFPDVENVEFGKTTNQVKN
ncbi:MAG: hypothetical protein IIB02_00720 [Thaumarchaeota archaeon]|nr:hypothetical protein [Nitrososphaerota archaeon]